MPGFVQGFMNFTTAIRALYGTLEAVVHPDKFYKNRDVLIINGARIIFSKIFDGDPMIPLALRYEHETDSEKDKKNVPDAPPESLDRHYRPPFTLPKEYSIQRLQFGDNVIHRECKNAVIELQEYLNALNKLADSGWVSLDSTLVYEFGHHNDAIRFVCFFIMHAFVELSKMDLNQRGVLNGAEQHINFLLQLKFDPIILEQFRKISVIRVAGQETTPLSVIDKAYEALSKIQEIIKYHLSKCSIFEQSVTLVKAVEAMIQHGFTYSAYIISKPPVSQLELAVKHRDEVPLRETRNDIALVRARVSNYLDEINPNAQARSTAPAQIAHASSAALVVSQNSDFRDLFFDPASQRWIGIPGRELGRTSADIYQPFIDSESGALLQVYLKYCSLLKRLGQVHHGIHHLQHLLRRGGDVIAVTHLSERIHTILLKLTQVVIVMDESEKKLSTFAQEHHRFLCRKPNPTSEERQWMTNYGKLQSHLCDQHSPKEEIISSIATISSMLTNWCNNPMEELVKFQQHLQKLDEVLQALAHAMPPLDGQPTLRAEAVVTAQIGHVAAMVTSPRGPAHLQHVDATKPGAESLRAVVSTRSKPSSLSHPSSVQPAITTSSLARQGTLMRLDKIRKLFTDYADLPTHAYQLDLSGNPPKLLNRNAQGPDHEIRALWIQNWVILLSSNAPEREVLIKLRNSIQQFKPTAIYKKHFTRIGPGKTGIEECIGLVEKELAAFFKEFESSHRVANPLMEGEEQPLLVNTSIQAENPGSYSPREPQSGEADDGIAMVETFNTKPATKDVKTPPGSSVHCASPSISWLMQQAEKFSKETVTTQARNEFLAFWRLLCFIRKPWFERERPMHRLRDYHVEYLTTARQALQEKAYWGEIIQALKSQNQPLIEWASKVVEQLLPKDRTKPLINAVDIKLQALQHAHENRDNSAKAAREKKFQLAANVSGAWVLTDHKQLERTLQGLLQGGPESSQVFLTLISHRLLQNQPTKPEDNKAFDDFLEQALTKHHVDYEKEEQRAYWETVIRGLLVLGANPLSWLDKQTINDLSITRTNVLMTQQAGIIMSHLEHRSQYAGEATAYLSTKLNQLTAAMEVFANALFACEESWWRSVVERFGSDKIKGARDERAAIFWSVIKWIYVFLNNEVLKESRPDAFTTTMEDAWNQMAAKNHQYEQILTKDFWTRQGEVSFTNLKTAVSNVKSALSTMGMSRFAKQSAELLQKKDTLLQEKDLAISNSQRQGEVSLRKTLLKNLKAAFIDAAHLSIPGVEAKIQSAVADAHDTFEESFERIHIERVALDLIKTDASFSPVRPFIVASPRRQNNTSASVVPVSVFQAAAAAAAPIAPAASMRH